MKTTPEFNHLRSRMYNDALNKYPDARKEDREWMRRLLYPKASESVLEVGAGTGYFIKDISKAVGEKGRYVCIDPSLEQSKYQKWIYKKDNKKEKDWFAYGYIDYESHCMGAEEIMDNLKIIGKESFDKIWSFGAFHHCPRQEIAIKGMYNALKDNGRLVICDVFHGSSLARHFDSFVAQYSITGHDVKFLSDEYTYSVCMRAGFKKENINILPVETKWGFDDREDIGEFLYGLHGLCRLDPENMPSEKSSYFRYNRKRHEAYKKIVDSCESILGIEYIAGQYTLNWPMKALVAEK